MDYADIQDTLKTWLTVATGLKAIQEDEPRPALIRTEGFWIISAPDSADQIGEDYVTYAADPDAPNDVIPTVVGRRRFTVNIRCVCRTQTPTKNARHHMDRARTSLKKPSVLDHFHTHEIAIVRLDKAVNYDATLDNRVESISAAILSLACTTTDTDTTIGTIGSVGVSSTLSDPAGDVLPVPPNVTDLLIEE